MDYDPKHTLVTRKNLANILSSVTTLYQLNTSDIRPLKGNIKMWYNIEDSIKGMQCRTLISRQSANRFIPQIWGKYWVNPGNLSN